MIIFVAVAVAALCAGIKFGLAVGIGTGAALFVLMPYDNRGVRVQVVSMPRKSEEKTK